MSLTNIQKNDYDLPTALHWAVGIGVLNDAAQPHTCGFFVPKISVMTDWAEHSQEWPVASPVRQLRLVCLQVIGVAWRQVFNLFSGDAIMNNSPLVISNIPVRQDSEGRYCLNDLHKASGSNQKNKPYNFSRQETTKALQTEIEKGSHVSSLNKVQGAKWGTYACKELVYAYAMWISASFSLKVIRAYDASTSQPTKTKALKKTTPQRLLLTIDSDGTTSLMPVPDNAYIVPPANLKQTIAMELPDYTLVKRKDLIAIHRSFSNLQAAIKESANAWNSIADNTEIDALNV